MPCRRSQRIHVRAAATLRAIELAACVRASWPSQPRKT